MHSALVSVQPRWGAEVCQTIRHMAQLFVLQLRRTPLIGGSLCHMQIQKRHIQGLNLLYYSDIISKVES